MKKAAQVVVVNALVLAALLVTFEAAAQAVAAIWPTYDVLFLQPDRFVGWKQVPGHKWRWTGGHWYAADFSVQVQTNAEGFRDLPRTVTKPDGVVRIAMLGDSFIEAVQVSLDKTASQLLDRRLNDERAASGEKWEVLNFGISNFGVGQYLLTWQHYAQKYSPDYVTAFVAQLHMQRTSAKSEVGAFAATAKHSLWVRPTFHLANDTPVLEPAVDYDQFIQAQSDVIQDVFHGERSRRRHSLVTRYFANRLKNGLATLLHEPQRTVTGERERSQSIALNIQLLQALGRQVTDSGGRFVVVDVSGYFGDDEIVSNALRELCSSNDFLYVPAYQDLLTSERNGTSTRWQHDAHLNETGNAILAESLRRAIVKERRR